MVQTRHRQDRLVLSGVAVCTESARQVRSASERVGRRSATAGRTPTHDALVGPTQFPPPDTRHRLSCRVWRVV